MSQTRPHQAAAGANLAPSGLSQAGVNKLQLTMNINANGGQVEDQFKNTKQAHS